MQINKSDRNDAVGIARIMQCGWYKEVRVKDLDSHAIKALLVSRALLVKIKRDIENQVRGLLKNLRLVIGQAKMNVLTVRATELAEARPELAAAIEPLLKAREAIERQIVDLDRKVMRLARNDAQVRRFYRYRVSHVRACARHGVLHNFASAEVHDRLLQSMRVRFSDSEGQRTMEFTGYWSI